MCWAPRTIWSAILFLLLAVAPPDGVASAAEYFGQTSAMLRLTDEDGAALPSAVVDTAFVEAAGLTETSGSGIVYSQADASTGPTGAIDGVQTLLGLAGASTGVASRAEAGWLGGVLVQSRAGISVRANVSLFSVVAGSVVVPEEVASSAVTLDLVFAAVDPACAASAGTTARGLDLDCFEVVVRIPLDDQHGVALPDYLMHTLVSGATKVRLTASLVEGALDAPVPPTEGATRQAVIGISAGSPVLVGIAATAIGTAEVTTAPHCFGAVATIVGTEGDDEIRGTPRDDVVVGLGGDDIIGTREGNDLICAGEGDDRVVGHKDDDWIAGEGGHDKIDGYYGDDVVFGGPGNDFIQGCNGDDILDGGPGSDTIRGERGADLMLGGTGNDELKGASGSDVIFSGQDVAIDVAVTLSGLPPFGFSTAFEPDHDRANGDRNDDVIEGGPGNDLLKGNKGHDLIVGGSGVDMLDGGGGSGDSCADEDSDTALIECEQP